MEVKTDTRCLTEFNSADKQLGAEFIKYADDEVVVKEIINRDLIIDVLEELSESQLDVILNSLGYIKAD